MKSAKNNSFTSLASSATLCFLIAAFASAGCSGKDAPDNAVPANNKGTASATAENKGQKKPAGPVPVIVAQVVRKTMPVLVRAIGNVEAYSTVALKTRIDGQIAKVHFSEGQEMRKGDLLFTLDLRDAEAKLRQAEADLERDKAQLEYARAQENRYQSLVKQDLVSKEMYQQMRMNLGIFVARIEADEAAIDTAKLQLEYGRIRSPINGVTGKLLFHEGNIIKAIDTNPLVIINQISPIYVTFSVPEKYLDSIRKYKAAEAVKVQASVSEDASQMPVKGRLAFIDNTVEAATGSIKLKASFINTDKRLWPGQFANVTLILYEEEGAVVAPSPSIQAGPKGQYVFVITDDMAAELRLVGVDRSDAAETVIASGLEGGETVVVNGQSRLAPGAKVQIKHVEPLP